MDSKDLKGLTEAYSKVYTSVDEAVKGADTEMRKAASAERGAGDKRVAPSKAKAYAKHAMNQAAYVDKKTKGKFIPGYAYGEEVELDQMIESLVERGHTEQEAYALVAQFTFSEGYQRNPEKGEKEDKKYASVRGEKTPMPPRGDKRREDFEKWYAKQMGR